MCRGDEGGVGGGLVLFVGYSGRERRGREGVSERLVYDKRRRPTSERGDDRQLTFRFESLCDR